MVSRLVRWTVGVGLFSVVLLALPLLPLTTTGSSVSYASVKSDLLDVNTATAEQIKSLPGIGDAYSGEILKGRPYAGKDELMQKKIIPQSAYEGIKYKIVARQK